MGRQFNSFIKSHSDSDLIKSLQTESNIGPFSKALCAAILAGNDLHHIHLHVKDKSFDRVHSITNDYYDDLSEESDWLAELAMEFGEQCPNFTLASNLLPSWNVLTEDAFDYESSIKNVGIILGNYISALEALKQAIDSEDVISSLDDKIRDWKKEADFKNKQRL